MRRNTPIVILLAALLPMVSGPGCRRRPPADSPEPSARERIQRTLPPPPAPGRLPLAMADDDLPAQFGAVWWTIAPTGAILRIAGPQGDLVSTTATERVAIPLRTDFYLVEVSHPGYETFSRRMSLGGAATNQTITLTPVLPPLPPPLPAAAVAKSDAPKQSPATPPARAPRRALTLQTLEGQPASEPFAAAGQGTPSKAPVQPTHAIPVPAGVGPARADAPGTPLQRTERVRIRVVSTVPQDTFLPQAVKHLHVGRRDLIPLHGLSIEIPYAHVGDQPLILRVQHYETQPASQTATAHAPDGVREVVFRVVPHPVAARLAGAPEGAEVWQVEVGQPLRRIGSAARTLWLEPFREYALEVRSRGFQPARVVLSTPEPAVTLPDTNVLCLPLPRTARPGQTCRIDLGNGVDLHLAWVPGGRVVLTDPRFAGAPPDVRVETLPRSFWMAQAETTRAQWTTMLPESGTEEIPAAEALPKTGVSWGDATRFAQRMALVLKQGTVRLPTEAEWEHAAAGGNFESFGGVSPASIRHAGNSAGKPADALSGPRNAWMLHHLCGNVREWCADRHAPYRGGPAAGPVRHVVRGGGYRSPLADCEVTVRDAEPPGAQLPDLGFRIVIFPDKP